MKLILSLLIALFIPLQLIPATTAPISSPTSELKTTLLSSKTMSFLKEKINWSHNKLRTIFSNETQKCIVGAYIFLQVIVKIRDSRQRDRTRLRPDQIPQSFVQAINDLHKKLETGYTINNIFVFKQLSGLNAAATSNGSIWVSKEFLEQCTPAEQRYVIGHEVTHITHHHIYKNIAIYLGAVFLLPVILRSVMCIIKGINDSYKLSPHSKDGKLLRFITWTAKTINDNPLVLYMTCLAINAYFSRSFEKEADLISASKLEAAQGGLDFFNRVLKEPNTKSWHYFLNPINAFDYLDYKLFPSHPSISTRMEYLSALTSNKVA